jgi:hypothetical protein
VAGSKFVLLNRPGATQAAVRISVPLPSVEEAFLPQGRLLGRHASWEVNEHLREALGLTYGTGAGLQIQTQAAALMVQGAIDNRGAAVGVKYLVDYLKSINTRPIEEAALARDKVALEQGVAISTPTSAGSRTAFKRWRCSGFLPLPSMTLWLGFPRSRQRMC